MMMLLQLRAWILLELSNLNIWIISQRSEEGQDLYKQNLEEGGVGESDIYFSQFIKNEKSCSWEIICLPECKVELSLSA